MLLGDLGLGALADSPVGLLPDHARRAIAMGRRLLCPPEILLLDEPTRGLSDQAATRLVALTDGARRDGVAVLVTGSPDDPMQGIADETLDLQDGTIR